LNGANGKPEFRVHVRLARQADGGAGAAVISHPARDDLLSLRLPERIPVIPGELDRGVVRLRARALKDNAGHGHRRDFQKRLGELDGRLVRAMAIKVVIAEFAHLLGGDLREALGAKSQRRAP